MISPVPILPGADRPPRHPASAAARHLVCIASGKGGVGKTWFAVTLSHALASLGQRTLLFDGDLGLANVDVQLGLMPERDLGSVVDGKMRLQDVIFAYGPGGFDVVAGRSGSASLAALEQPSLLSIRDELLRAATRYQRVVIDLGAGVEGGVRTLAEAGGTVLVVSTDEPTSLTDAYAFIKLTSQRNPRADLRVVVNLASTLREGERTYGKLLKACENFLKLSPPLVGVVRRDERVRDTIRHQTSILTRHPAAEAAQDVEAIAARLVGQM